MVDSTPSVIGISGSSYDSASVRAMMRQVQEAGAIPMFLGNHANRNADADFAKIDALIVLGNNRDIDPSEYGQPNNQNEHTKSELVMEDGKTPDHDGIARRSYEFRMLELALKAGMPTLGVCGGMQRINVLLGGNLHQHVPDLVGHEEHAQQQYNIAPSTPVQPVLLSEGSTLSKIAGEIETVYTPGYTPTTPGVILENSMHHQAVAKLGKGLRIAATAEDTITDGSRLTEAVEADPDGPYGKQFLLGVQWHPEFGASPLGARITAHVTAAAQQFAITNERQHSLEEVLNENMLSALPKHATAPRPDSITDRILKKRTANDFSFDMAG